MSTMKTFQRSAVSLLAIVAFVLTACTSSNTGAPPAEGWSPPAAGADANWNQLVAAAQAERTLVLATHAGSGYEQFVQAAKEALPMLEIQGTTMKASDFVPRVVTEQQNGQYLWDVHVGPLSNIFTVLTPAGGLDPLQPYLDAVPAPIRDEDKWYGDFGMFTDPRNPVSLITSLTEAGGLYVNRALVPTGELNNPEDLLNPQWKGKIVVYDPTVSNGGSMSLAGLAGSQGVDYLRNLIQGQQVTYVETSRQATEWLAQGRYAVGFGMDDTYLTELQGRGVGEQVERNKDFATYVLSNGISVLKNPPHPNAARVFTAWFLSQDGQDAWARLASVDSNSRRSDVDVYHQGALPDYQNIGKYSVIQGTASGDEILKQTLQITNAQR
jgi:iron(III) transport system substrate-binding protein